MRGNYLDEFVSWLPDGRALTHNAQYYESDAASLRPLG